MFNKKSKLKPARRHDLPAIQLNAEATNYNKEATRLGLFVELRQGELACFDCGKAVAVNDKSPIVRLNVETPGIVPEPRFTQHAELRMTRCRTCSKRYQESEKYAEAYSLPVDDVHAVNNFAHVVGLQNGLEALYSTKETAQAFVWIAHGVAHGLPLGKAFAPINYHRLPLGAASIEPWAHLDVEQLEAAKEKLTELYAIRAIGKEGLDIETPDRLGCMFCGRSHVRVTRAAVLRNRSLAVAKGLAWRPAKISKSVLDLGPQGYVEGFLCPACDKAAKDQGSYGIRAQSQALLDHMKRYGFIKHVAPELRNGLIGETMGSDEWGMKRLTTWVKTRERLQKNGKPLNLDHRVPWTHAKFEDKHGKSRFFRAKGEF